MSGAELELIDTHCHLDPNRYAEGVPAVLERAQAAGVVQLLAIGASHGVGSNEVALALAAEHPWIFASVGIHPHEASLYSPEIEALLEGWARERPRVVAVGETGLDYHYNLSPPEVQRAAFAATMGVARRVARPVIIHTREAEEDTLAILRDEGAAEVGGVIHCFSGGAALAEGALALGMYISFSGIVTFKKSVEIQEVAKTMPLDRILVETDAPYLAPTPMRGRRNEPAYVAHTLRGLAALRGVEAAELAAITSANARRLFRLPGA